MLQPYDCSGLRKFKEKGHKLTNENQTTLPEGMPQLRVVPMPADANVYGDVFGGWIMSQVDIAGALPATRRANGRVATVAVTSFQFKHPVFVGDLLSVYASVVRVGTTSITVNVEVYAERNRLQADIVKVTEATLTYVATGDDRKPRPLPALLPETPDRTSTGQPEHGNAR
jgi:acyl-CoA thioesterase YciA